MDEVYLDLAFMVFALGFFMFVIHYVVRSQDRDYERKLNEAREFGFQDSKLKREARRIFRF